VSKDTLPGGHKARQREDGLDRTIPYVEARRKFGAGAPYPLDIDSVEWAFAGGEWHPIVALELTLRDRYKDGKDWGATPSPAYFAAILERYHGGVQAEIARRAGRLLGCPVLIVVYDEDVHCLWYHNLSNPKGWTEVSLDTWKAWLLSAATKKREEFAQQTPEGDTL
jgi:hypothetical protein